MDLSQTDDTAWRDLAVAASDPQSSLRYLTLCSVDADLSPQARTVVLRKVDQAAKVLEFHTDIRSPKWVEFSRNPCATVLGYAPDTRIQLRLAGEVELFPPETAHAMKIWAGLPPWTQGTYAGGPPGDEAALGVGGDAEALEGSDGGQARFGVIRFRADMLDWCQLARHQNTRAKFHYDPGGRLRSSAWVNP